MALKDTRNTNGSFTVSLLNHVVSLFARFTRLYIKFFRVSLLVIVIGAVKTASPNYSSIDFLSYNFRTKILWQNSDIIWEIPVSLSYAR